MHPINDFNVMYLVDMQLSLMILPFTPNQVCRQTSETQSFTNGRYSLCCLFCVGI